MRSHCDEQSPSHDEQRAELIRALDDTRVARQKEKHRRYNHRYRALNGPALNEKKRQKRRVQGMEPKKRASPEERRDRLRSAALKTNYGITLEEKTAMLVAQGNGCAICKTTKFGKRAPHTDHCHKTGKVRGVLCARCNRGLGYFWDNPELFRTAANYLEGQR